MVVLRAAGLQYVMCGRRIATPLRLRRANGSWPSRHSAGRHASRSITCRASFSVNSERAESKSARTEQLVSIVVPVYNEKESLVPLIERIAQAMCMQQRPYEIICVDDGSRDGTTTLLKQLASRREDLKAVIFVRNYGQTAAMSAGLAQAAGSLVVTMDGDLQNDPADIPALLNCLVNGHQTSTSAMQPWGFGGTLSDGGYDMVCGWRKDRKDDVLTRTLPSRVANWLIGTLTGVKLHDYGCSLKAYRSSLAMRLPLHMLGEMHRFIPALAAIEGATITEMPVTHHAREFGRSKYGALTRTPRVLLDLLTVLFLRKYADRPAHFFGMAGLACLAGSAAVAVCALVLAATRAVQQSTGHVVTSSGNLVVVTLLLTLSGAQFLSLGLVAEMVMRSSHRHQGTTAYRIQEVV
eukprot:jgi/Chlat1/5371/Chrsp35S05295